MFIEVVSVVGVCVSWLLHTFSLHRLVKSAQNIIWYAGMAPAIVCEGVWGSLPEGRALMLLALLPIFPLQTLGLERAWVLLAAISVWLQTPSDVISTVLLVFLIVLLRCQMATAHRYAVILSLLGCLMLQSVALFRWVIASSMTWFPVVDNNFLSITLVCAALLLSALPFMRYSLLEEYVPLPHIVWLYWVPVPIFCYILPSEWLTAFMIFSALYGVASLGSGREKKVLTHVAFVQGVSLSFLLEPFIGYGAVISYVFVMLAMAAWLSWNQFAVLTLCVASGALVGHPLVWSCALWGDLPPTLRWLVLCYCLFCICVLVSVEIKVHIMRNWRDERWYVAVVQGVSMVAGMLMWLWR